MIDSKHIPRVIKALNKTAIHYKDDEFFIILIGSKWFIFNWTLGVSLPYNLAPKDCREFEMLIDRGEYYLKNPPRHLDPGGQEYCKHEVIPHLRGAASWSDFFLGDTGIPLHVNPTTLKDGEKLILGTRDCYAFRTRSGVRYLVKKRYFDLVEDIIGLDYEPAIFRASNNKRAYPKNYRPMVFYRDREPLAFCYATSEELLWINHTSKGNRSPQSTHSSETYRTGVTSPKRSRKKKTYSKSSPVNY